ncbi:hypothetical protein [Ponticaulis sp.]|uniref:hypothetical protein n=1 Tax=Ponticaulis sp. TaxID=2020902 RepID=UPI0025F7BC39|nr:hypothetical protein [Ponticaulis sp.]|tara:strand:+ start:5120 stop:5296 length:177 start_codon:yes stop_codon:yes gene_type:complete
MSKQPKLLNRTIIGSKQDLMAAIAELPGDLDGLEEDYVMNVYHDESTNEKWLEIEPAN